MAKKKESTLINMLVALLVITAVSGGVLGLVYGLTKDAIADVERQKNEAAIQAVLPLEGEITYQADTLRFADENGNTVLLPCNLAFNNANELKGAAIKTSESGFGGKIELMVGITTDGVIKGVSVLSHTETPGLGANMEGKFKNQFANRKPGEGFVFEVTKNIKKEPNKVDAITAATITSRAFTKAVEKAYQAFETNKNRFINAAPVEVIEPDAEDIEVEEGGNENE